MASALRRVEQKRTPPPLTEGFGDASVAPFDGQRVATPFESSVSASVLLFSNGRQKFPILAYTCVALPVNKLSTELVALLKTLFVLQLGSE